MKPGNILCLGFEEEVGTTASSDKKQLQEVAVLVLIKTHASNEMFMPSCDDKPILAMRSSGQQLAEPAWYMEHQKHPRGSLPKVFTRQKVKTQPRACESSAQAPVHSKS